MNTTTITTDNAVGAVIRAMGHNAGRKAGIAKFTHDDALLEAVEAMIGRNQFDAAYWVVRDITTAMPTNTTGDERNYKHALANLEHILDGLRNAI